MTKKSTEMIEKKIKMHTCLRCGHQWEPRPNRRISDEAEPRTCPHCKSPWWNVIKK